MDTELSQERREFLQRDYCRGFIQFCGFQVTRVDKGVFESTITIGDNHKTQDNFVHAGLIATMADHTAGYAAYTLVPETMRILSIEFKVNLFKPSYGRALRCKAEVVNQGRQVIVAQSTIFDVRDTYEKMVARATVTLMAVDGSKLVRKEA